MPDNLVVDCSTGKTEMKDSTIEFQDSVRAMANKALERRNQEDQRSRAKEAAVNALKNAAKTDPLYNHILVLLGLDA